jgi:hypothetical protein
VEELRTALQDATREGAAPIDVVHYDACLMAILENAYQIQDYASYLVASQNLGWSFFAYRRYAAHVTASTTPAQLVANVVQDYHDLALQNRRLPHTLSALDLEKTGAVEDAVTALARTLQASPQATQERVYDARATAQKFDSRYYFRIDNEDEYVDLYDLARLLKQNISDSAVQSDAQAVMDAVDSCVIVEQHASGRYLHYPYWDLDNAHGISIYFPPVPGGWGYDNYMLPGTYQFVADGEWDEFLQSHFATTPPETTPDPGVPPTLNSYLIYLPYVLKAQ